MSSGAALVVAAGTVQHARPPAVPPDAGTVPVAAGQPATTVPSSRSGLGDKAAAVAPALLQLPGATATVVRAAVADGALTLPADVREVGWWIGGAGVTSTRGSIVLAGHVDSAEQGLGALSALRDVNPGARITLRTSTGRVRTFVVTGRRSYAKATGLPASVFDQAVALRLVLVTCTGHFDASRRSYDDNLVVYASPA